MGRPSSGSWDTSRFRQPPSPSGSTPFDSSTAGRRGKLQSRSAFPRMRGMTPNVEPPCQSGRGPGLKRASRGGVRPKCQAPEGLKPLVMVSHSRLFRLGRTSDIIDFGWSTRLAPVLSSLARGAYVMTATALRTPPPVRWRRSLFGRFRSRLPCKALSRGSLSRRSAGIAPA